jgi:hypothetical protein
MDDQYSKGKKFPTLVIKIMCSATAYYVLQEKNARNLQHESKDARIVQHEVSLCVRSRLNLVKVGVGKLTGYQLLTNYRS